jgi:hypothetical protein
MVHVENIREEVADGREELDAVGSNGVGGDGNKSDDVLASLMQEHLPDLSNVGRQTSGTSSGQLGLIELDLGSDELDDLIKEVLSLTLQSLGDLGGKRQRSSLQSKSASLLVLGIKDIKDSTLHDLLQTINELLGGLVLKSELKEEEKPESANRLQTRTDRIYEAHTKVRATRPTRARRVVSASFLVAMLGKTFWISSKV